MELGGFNSEGNWSQTSELTELEPLGMFEPQIRARSNTWPCPRPDNIVDTNEDAGSKKNSTQNLQTAGNPPLPSSAVSSAKKNSSRRNAWGNLSYADLITQAITSAADNRLTLSQIYEWMVQNVPYFKDKGDSNSSAGWKNSIRHNLSLHNRFMRVQNEGTGKSSWWMINPDAKPGKPNRRRATSMETSKYEKKRGRIKKKVDALKNGLPADATPSPSSSISEGLDIFPDSPLHSGGGFQLSPQDFRQRASSNASSCGRISPMSTVYAVESDWVSEYALATKSEYPPDYPPNPQADQLAGSLANSVNLHGNDPVLNTYTPTTMAITQPSDYPFFGDPPSYPVSTHGQFVRPAAPPLQQLQNGPSMLGQIMGALNPGVTFDEFNLDHTFDCNVEEDPASWDKQWECYNNNQNDWLDQATTAQPHHVVHSQVINHELNAGESLDFNFHQAIPETASGGATMQQGQPPPYVKTSSSPPPPPPYTTAPSWVH